MQLGSDSTEALLALALLMGAIAGSFLNMLIYRLPLILKARWYEEAREVLASVDPQSFAHLPRGLQYWAALWGPRSICPHCHQVIPFYHNIPILSWLMLRGRCHACGAFIGVRYLVVELLAVAAAAAAASHFGATPAGLLAALFLWGLLALAVIDFQTRLLPDELTLLLLWIGLLANSASLFISPSQAIWGAAVGYLLLWSLYWLFWLISGKEGLGYGDFKLVAALGAWLGWEALVQVLLLASLGALGVALLLRLLKRLQPGEAFPFGPFLAASGAISLFAPDLIGSAL